MHNLLFVFISLLFSASLFGQHTEIEHNSSSSAPHLQLVETDDDNFARLWLSNDNVSRWAFNAMSSAGSMDDSGILSSPLVFAYNGDQILGLSRTGSLRINQAYTLPNVSGTAGQVLTMGATNNAVWATPTSGGQGAFEIVSGVVRSTGTGTEDYIFGAQALPANGQATSDTMFFFDHSKGAFRGGSLLTSVDWSPDSIGVGSFAFGLNTKASGFVSTAIGIGTIASGNSSTAIGNGTTASGFAATAMGDQTVASGTRSTAMGEGTVASGISSIAMGNRTTASGQESTAMGNGTIASGTRSTAMGSGTVASTLSSTAMGINTEARGERSTAMGSDTEAIGNSSTAIGNGTTASGNSSTAMGFLTAASGDESIAMGGFTIARGDRSTAMGNETEASGASSTAMGNATVASGSRSTAMGQETVASGGSSTAMGQGTEASGLQSTAMGVGTEASGSLSTAMGDATVASGFVSTAMGSNTEAKGPNSVAAVNNTIANGTDEMVVGRYNDTLVTTGQSLSSDSPLFSVGNGLNNANRSNAFVVKYSGLVEIPDSLVVGSFLQIGQGEDDRIYIGNDHIRDGGADILRAGANFTPDGTNLFNLGGTNHRWKTIFAVNGTINTSDLRAKKNISGLSYGLDEILQLHPDQYNWNQDNEGQDQSLGLIAQEILKVIPEVVHVPEEAEELMGVNYAELVPVLIKAIQEQEEIIKHQASRLEEQEEITKHQASKLEEHTIQIQKLLHLLEK